MPLYSYRCLTCATKLDRLSTIAERDALRECPVCDGLMQRVMAPIAGFVFRAPGYRPYWTADPEGGSETMTGEKCYAADKEGNVL